MHRIFNSALFAPEVPYLDVDPSLIQELAQAMNRKCQGVDSSKFLRRRRFSRRSSSRSGSARDSLLGTRRDSPRRPNKRPPRSDPRPLLDRAQPSTLSSPGTAGPAPGASFGTPHGGPRLARAPLPCAGRALSRATVRQASRAAHRIIWLPTSEELLSENQCHQSGSNAEHCYCMPRARCGVYVVQCTLLDG